jgi:NADH-quinone oxidoreductase subunit G
MGLTPTHLPGYQPAPAPGLDETAIFAAAASGNLSALYVVGSNPVARLGINRSALKDTFVVVQDLFLTETALLADVVLPAASLYEKTGSVTSTYGDLQQVRKAADRAGTRSDLELIVRIADCMGASIPELVRFTSADTADLGQTRGVQSGEADRTAVFLAAQGLEPRLSPFNPAAVLDEIHATVPGYAFNRLQYLCGNPTHLEPPAAAAPAHPSHITPANDTLFTSGTLGRYSAALADLRAHAPHAINKEAAHAIA